ncbi:MAG: Na+/H+ antiporter subunit E [Pseudomonadota bacterium]
MRYIVGAAGLFSLWLLMSGVYKPVQISAGAISAVFAVWIARRMDVADGKPLQYKINFFRLSGYIVWLLKEIAVSNFVVARHILSFKRTIRPNILRVPFGQKSDIGQTIFANSITLTPATLSVEVGQKRILVHALAYDESDHDALADMDARVRAIESD